MKTLISYLQLLPTILAAVKSLEEAIPLPMSGKQKLDLLIATVQTAYAAEQTIQKEVPWTQVESVVKSVAGVVVNALNVMGLFRHSTPAPTPSK